MCIALLPARRYSSEASCFQWCLFVGASCVCLSIYDNSLTVSDIIMEFLREQDMVKSSDQFRKWLHSDALQCAGGNLT